MKMTQMTIITICFSLLVDLTVTNEYHTFKYLQILLVKGENATGETCYLELLPLSPIRYINGLNAQQLTIQTHFINNSTHIYKIKS